MRSRRAPKRVGIRDVAAAAGVSVTTVSHALNGKGRLPEETRELVRETARRLGYRPNPSAQRLLGGRTGLLGLVVASQGVGSPAMITQTAYFMLLVAAASRTALDHGYALVMATSEPEGDQAWQQAPLDGAVVVDPVADDPTVAYLAGAGTPIVTTGRVPGGPSDRHWVDNDHRAATALVLDHLADRGAQRVALITGPVATSYALDLRSAYEEWCARIGAESRIEEATGDLGEASGFAAAARLLEGSDRPDALFAAFDRLALGASLAATTSGLRVPDGLLIAGYTDSAANAQAVPSITALELDPEQIGQRAVEALIELLEEGAPAPIQAHVPVSLVERASTERLAARAPRG